MTIFPSKRNVNNGNTEETSETGSQNDRSSRHRDDINDEVSTNRRSFQFENERKELSKRFKESSVEPRDRRERERQKQREARRDRKRERIAKRANNTEVKENIENSNSADLVVPGPSGTAAKPKEFNTINKAASGYNSEDEYESRKSVTVGSAEDWVKRDHYFGRGLAKLGFEIKQMHEDGACLFRAIADQVYGDQELHATVRSQCMDYIVKNQDFFASYVTEDFEQYVERKRKWNCHGNHLEIQALSEMYNRPIEVYCYHTEPINIFNASSLNSYEPIRLSYHRMCHYNSITNPKKPSVLVGLGIPNYCTRCDLDRRDVHDAVRQSEELLIEQTMLEDKIKATDWEATSEAMEEEIARQSYIQFYQDAERRLKTQNHSTASATATAGSSSTITSGMCSSPRSSRRGSVSPKGSMSPKGDTSPKLYLSQTSSSHQKCFPEPYEKLENGQYESLPTPINFTDEKSSTPYKTYSNETESTEPMPGDPIPPPNIHNCSNINYDTQPSDYKGWDETIMAQVLAESQLTYFEDLKRKVKKHCGSPGPSTSKV